LQALANLTLNQTEYHVLTSHEDLGILDNNGTLSASINVNGAASLATLVPLLNHVVMVTGDVVITNIPLASISTLTGLFGNLVTVGGNVVITNSHGLTSLGVAFPSLTSIGGMVQVTGCDSLTNMDGAFPRLQSIGTFMKLYSNDLYVSNRTGTAFAMLNSIGGQSLTLGGIPFVAATMIHYGDIISYPGSTSTQGDFATAVRNTAGIRIITGTLDIRQDTTLTSFNPLGGDLVSVGGQLVLYNCDAVTSMNGLMPNLRVTGGQLYLHSLSGVTTFGTAFANLQMIGGNLYFRYSSRQLVSLRNAFPQLRNITGALQLYNLEYVTDMSGSFPELRWVNSLLSMYYLRRVSVGTLFPKVEYAGGIRIQATFYYSSTSSTMNLDGIFPMLLRVGSANFLIRDCEYATSMNNAFPLLVRNDRALDIFSNNRMQTITGSFPLLAYNGYTFRFQWNAAMTTMDGAFPALQSVGNWMHLRNFGALLSMDGAFSSLRIVPQQLYIIDNNRLASMNNSFTSLTTIGSNFYLYRSYSLTSLGNSFENIQSIKNLKFYGLGSSSSQSSNQDAFCASARAVLCPVSTRYYHKCQLESLVVGLLQSLLRNNPLPVLRIPTQLSSKEPYKYGKYGVLPITPPAHLRASLYLHKSCLVGCLEVGWLGLTCTPQLVRRSQRDFGC
jgi:hypothetical protein